MVGMGYARQQQTAKVDGLRTVDSDSDGNAIAYKGGAGVSYAFTDTIVGDLGYEYLATTLDNFSSHNVVAGVRFKF